MEAWGKNDAGRRIIISSAANKTVEWMESYVSFYFSKAGKQH